MGMNFNSGPGGGHQSQVGFYVESPVAKPSGTVPSGRLRFYVSSMLGTASLMVALSKYFPGGSLVNVSRPHGCGSKIGTPTRTLVSGNMDQNVRNPS